MKLFRSRLPLGGLVQRGHGSATDRGYRTMTAVIGRAAVPGCSFGARGMRDLGGRVEHDLPRRARLKENVARLLALTTLTYLALRTMAQNTRLQLPTAPSQCT